MRIVVCDGAIRWGGDRGQDIGYLWFSAGGQ